jgi:DNA-directed RNA polymerase omega subunit
MAQQDQEQGSAADTQPATPITSRFLFVDVAAQRAKQLRRGALPRLERGVQGPHKLERVAMEEVRAGAIHYTLPTTFDGSPRAVSKG